MQKSIAFARRATYVKRGFVWSQVALGTVAMAGVLTTGLADNGLAFQTSADPQEAFEVASLKVSPRLVGGAIPIGKSNSPGRISMRGMTPKALIMWAYDIKEYQIRGPAWISAEWYDLDAKSAQPTSDERMRLMGRTLLSQRFKLVIHREAATVPIYTLVRGKDVSMLHPASASEEPRYVPRERGVYAKAITLPKFAELLSQKVDRPVTDLTGIRGVYNFDLRWDPDPTPSSANEINPAPPDLGRSVFVAVREQLGLVLEAVKGPIEMLVIDHIEKAAEN